MQEVDGTLGHWPEGCRAILLAGAWRNVADNTWWTDVRNGVDAADGSGAMDTLESVKIAKLRRFRNAPGTRRGWHAGGLGSSDFDGDGLSTFSYQARVPSGLLPWRVKVAATILIETLEIGEGSLPRRALALVLEWANEHRGELRENWRLADVHEPLAPIEPLK